FGLRKPSIEDHDDLPHGAYGIEQRDQETLLVLKAEVRQRQGILDDIVFLAAEKLPLHHEVDAERRRYDMTKPVGFLLTRRESRCPDCRRGTHSTSGASPLRNASFPTA